jgi:hypothetical protein
MGFLAVSIAYCLLPIACLDTENHRDTESHRGTTNEGFTFYVISYTLTANT